MPSSAPKGSIILGGGGHASVLIDALQRSGPFEIVGLTDPDAALWGTFLMGVPVIGNDDAILDYSPDEVSLVNALGSIFNTAPRRHLFETWQARGYVFANVIHPTAIVASSARLGVGVQLLAGCIVSANASVGPNSVVNTGAIVEHDCVIAQHVHLAPGVTLSGNVTVGEGCHLGTGSVVVQNIGLGEGCVVGAGAVVTASVEAYTLVVGVPARVVRRLRD